MGASPAHRGIAVFTLGHLAAEAVDSLSAHFDRVEILPLGLEPDASLAASQTVLRAAVNRAAHDWVLLLREGETVTAAGAAEMGASVTDPPRAWGFRLRLHPSCGGRRLLIDGGPPEIRVFHRRHARFDLRGRGGEMNIEGTVLRLREPIERELFPSDEEHRAWLAAQGVPHSGLRRILLFARRAFAARALFRSRATLRYLWDEAGWDRGESGVGSRES